MLCKCHWIVLYTVHFTAFCLGGPFFPGHGVDVSVWVHSADLWPGRVAVQNMVALRPTVLTYSECCSVIPRWIFDQ